MSLDVDGFIVPLRKQLTIGGDPTKSVRVKGVTFRTPQRLSEFYTAWDPDEVKHCLQAAEALGANTLRVWLPRELDDERMASIAAFVHMVREHGMKAYFILHWPQLYAEEGSSGDAANLSYLGMLTAELAADTTVFGWDLYNEADWVSDESWQWDMDRQAAAVRLSWLRRMTDMLHELDGNHLVSMGATFSYSYWVPDVPFTLESFVDIVDFHYYHRTYRSSTLADEIAACRAHSDKPIMLGELGMSSDPAYKTPGEPVHNEEVQRLAYTEFVDTIRESVECVGCIQWTLADYGKPQKPQEEEHYGILRTDLSRKPAAEVYAEKYKVEPFLKPEHRE